MNITNHLYQPHPHFFPFPHDPKCVSAVDNNPNWPPHPSNCVPAADNDMNRPPRYSICVPTADNDANRPPCPPNCVSAANNSKRLPCPFKCVPANHISYIKPSRTNDSIYLERAIYRQGNCLQAPCSLI